MRLRNSPLLCAVAVVLTLGCGSNGGDGGTSTGSGGANSGSGGASGSSGGNSSDNGAGNTGGNESTGSGKGPVYGMTIPPKHPRLFWTQDRLTQAKTWWAK